MEIVQDIAFEIFSRLPAKSICKLKSTCKSFSKFSEESTFKTKQAHNLLERDDTCFFIQPEQIRQRYEKRVEIHSLPKEYQSSGVPDNALAFLSNSACVLASSNGLVLCCTNDDDQLNLFVCNPVTKSWSSIPTPESLKTDHKYANINLMLDCCRGSSDDDYSVFLFENTAECLSTYICNVYHGNEGVWKPMKNCFFRGGRNMKFDMPVFHNGAVHFISDSGLDFARWSPFYEPYIMSYNLEDGTSTMLKLPTEGVKDCHNICNLSIFNWGKVSTSNRSICLLKLTKFVLTVWILKDYESSSWLEVLNITVEELGLKETDVDFTEFTVMNGNLLVFATEEKIYSCELDNEKFRIVEEICQHNCGPHPRFISYSDTLRSCGRNARTMPC